MIDHCVSNKVSLDRAIDELLAAHSDNRWFVDAYWPENKDRVLRMVADVKGQFPDGARVLDVGCGNGYISFLFARIGYDVTAVDAWMPPERENLFASAGVKFIYANLNHLAPFAGFRRDFDVILMGEVIEHILNCPLDLLRSAGGAARPGALLVLTTPNPATLMNVWRLLRNRHCVWGTRDFMAHPKIDGGKIITEADINYREYTAMDLHWMIKEAGFHVVASHYVMIGPSNAQPTWKRRLKESRVVAPLFRTRLFGSGHYIVATGPSAVETGSNPERLE